MADESRECRKALLGAYGAALDAARGDRLVADWLPGLDPGGEMDVVAMGKAAASMLDGARRVLGGRLRRCFLVVPGAETEVAGSNRACERHAGDHPLPGARSLAAGEALLAFLERAPAGGRWLFLLSGGASGLVEVLPRGIAADDLEWANQWLLGSGLDIVEINAVRQRLSAIKGGRLAARLGGRPATVLALSDVPGNDPAVIGSGCLASPLPAPDAGALPERLAALLGNAPPEPDPGVFRTIDTLIVGDNATAVEAAAAHLAARDAAVYRHPQWLEGDVDGAATMIADTLSRGESGYHLWGGECSVRLPDSPGRGGRCQHLALAAAERLAGRDGWALLAAGTDGRDGDSDAAGALVDGGTVQRGVDAGGDPADALTSFDSHAFLRLAGDLVDTGPTGTNVCDLVIGVKT